LSRSARLIVTIDPGIRNLGLAVYEATGPTGKGRTGAEARLHNHCRISCDTWQEAALQAVEQLRAADQLYHFEARPLLGLEAGAYTAFGSQATPLAKLAGGLELWALLHRWEVVLVPIGTLKKCAGIKGNAPRKEYVIALRKLYPMSFKISDDERVAMLLGQELALRGEKAKERRSRKQSARSTRSTAKTQ
jgi:hypothetical protein